MVDFLKYHGLGNDYLVVDPSHTRFQADAPTARALCDRHFGVGADGVLFGPSSAPEAGQPVDLLVFNADGTACGRSANGIRIFALYLAQHHPHALTRAGGRCSELDRSGGEVTVRTIAGDSTVHVCDVDSGTVRVGLDRPSFDARDVPVRGLLGSALRWTLDIAASSLVVTSLNNGVPHTVVFTDDASESRARELGESIAGDQRFPGRTNVEFGRVVSRSVVETWIWERGAGYTLASGSGAAAVAAAARELGLVGEDVTVRMPGGEAQVTLDVHGHVWLTGVIEQVAAGDLSPQLRDRIGVRPRIETAELVGSSAR